MADAPARIETVMEPMAARLAGVYAESLLELTPDNDQAESLAVELSEIVKLTREIEGSDVLLAGFLFNDRQRVELIQRIFGERVNKSIEGLLAVMAANHRMELLAGVAGQFREMLENRKGMVEVDIVTAIRLDKRAREELTASLRKTLNAEPLLRTRVDADLIGGAVLKIEDRVYDASLLAELNRMRRRLSGRTTAQGSQTNSSNETETQP